MLLSLYVWYFTVFDVTGIGMPIATWRFVSCVVFDHIETTTEAELHRDWDEHDQFALL